MNIRLIPFQGEGLVGMDISALEDLQRLHVEAITKICHAKVVVTRFILAFY